MGSFYFSGAISQYSVILEYVRKGAGQTNRLGLTKGFWT